MPLQGVGLRNTEKLSSRRRLGLGRGGRVGVGELLTCIRQHALDLRRLGMRITEYALPRFCDGLERLHGFAVISERGAVGSIERERVIPPTMLRPRDKFHTLIRADSLKNNRWQETEAKFLSYSSDALPPQDRWKASLPPGQNTTAPRPRHI